MAVKYIHNPRMSVRRRIGVELPSDEAVLVETLTIFSKRHGSKAATHAIGQLVRDGLLELPSAVRSGFKPRTLAGYLMREGTAPKDFKRGLGRNISSEDVRDSALTDKFVESAEDLVQSLVDAHPIRRPDELEEKLRRRAVDRILDGTTWLSSKQVGERCTASAKNPHSSASRMLSSNRAFAIVRNNQREFPAYQFDELGEPFPAMRTILNIFSELTPLQIASWFESTSSMLGGKRPRELLSTKPDAVIAAAQSHVQGPMHG